MSWLSVYCAGPLGRVTWAHFVCDTHKLRPERANYLCAPETFHLAVSSCLVGMWNTIWYDTMIFTCAQKLTYSQLNLPHGTKHKRIMKKLKIKTRDTQKKWSSHKAVVSVLRPEGSMVERFVKKVGFESGVKCQKLPFMVKILHLFQFLLTFSLHMLVPGLQRQAVLLSYFCCVV